MTEQHPIILDSKTIHRLSNGYFDPRQEGVLYDSLNRIAQWGADEELKACCEWLKLEGHEHEHAELRAARRPKPPSLKEQALAELEEIMTELHDETGSAFTASAIRRALEALPND